MNAILIHNYEDFYTYMKTFALHHNIDNKGTRINITLRVEEDQAA